MQYQIYWTPQTHLLELQGATVDFRALDTVFMNTTSCRVGKPW